MEKQKQSKKTKKTSFVARKHEEERTQSAYLSWFLKSISSLSTKSTIFTRFIHSNGEDFLTAQTDFEKKERKDLIK